MIFEDSLLKYVRFLVCKDVFKVFLKTYVKSLSLQAEEKENHSWFFGPIKVELINDIFCCSCGFAIKSGLPCHHQIYLIKSYRDNINHYIHKRWLLKY